MTCEICNQSRMDVQTWQVQGVIKYNACVPCARVVDDIIFNEQVKLVEIIKSMIESANKRKELKNDQMP